MKGVSSTAGFIQYQYRPSSLKLAKITDQSDPKMLRLEGGLVKEKTFLSQPSSNFYASIHIPQSITSSLPNYVPVTSSFSRKKLISKTDGMIM